jgi:hypothetical protein
MTDRYDALAGEIMRMMEDDRGLVRSKLADLLEKEAGNWKPDIPIGMVASASDHSKLSLKAQLMEAHWRECRAGEDVCEWNDQALRTSSLGPPDEPVLVKRRHTIFDDEMDRLRRQWDLEGIRGKRFVHLLHLAESEGLLPEVEPEPDSPSDAEVEIKQVVIDPFAELALQDYQEYLARGFYPQYVDAQKKEFMRNFARKKILSAKAFESQRAALSAARDIGFVTGTDGVLHALRRAVAPYWAQLATGQVADNKYVPRRFVLPVLGVGDVVAEPEWGNAGLLVTATWPDGQTRTYSMDDLRPNDTCGND